MTLIPLVFVFLFFQIFLYELDRHGKPSKRPRHCLPYAVISWKQRVIPLAVTPSKVTNSSRKAHTPSKSKSSCDDTESTAQQSSRLSPGKRESSVMQEKGATSLRSPENDPLTFEDLNSNQLDSKLNDIKKERQAVMEKLKAIQSMREVLTSGSCDSESEQEIDKALNKITNSSVEVDRKIARSVSSSGVDSKREEVGRREDGHITSQDGKPVGRSISHDAGRPDRIASTSGWRDPYHWTPYQRNTNGSMYGGGSSTEGHTHMQEFDYYQTDEQADMFDLEEMLYSGKMPPKQMSVKRPSGYNINITAGSFHDDVVHVPTPERNKSSDVAPCDGDNKDKTESPSSCDTHNPSNGTFNQGVVPTDEIARQSYDGTDEGSTYAGGDNKLSNNIPIQVSSDTGARTDPNCGAFKPGMAPPTNEAPVHGSPRYENSMAGGDSQLSTNIQVQDMDIDDSSQSSNSRTSSHIITPTKTNPHAFTSQSFPAVYGSQSYNSSYNSSVQNFSNPTILSIPSVHVPAPSTFSSVPHIPPPTVSAVPPDSSTCSSTYSNSASVLSQEYYNSYESSFEGAHANLDIPPPPPPPPPQDLASVDPISNLTMSSFQPVSYGTPSSSDTPTSDFSTSKVVSRGADGRLRLGSLSQSSDSSVEAPKVVFRRPPSPSEEQDPEGTMSSTAPGITDVESESKVMEPENMARGDVPAAGPLAKVIESGATSTAQSAIEALQKQVINTNNPTQAHALQMIMNSLLSKIIAPQKKAEIGKPAASSIQSDAQSNSGKTLKPQKPVKMFHGHPLIKKGKKPPRPILLEQLPNGPIPVDPRPARSSLFGRKFDMTLDVVPWAKNTCFSPIKHSKVKSHSSVNQDRTQNHPVLRDPRLQKQALTAAAYAPAPKVVVDTNIVASVNKVDVQINQESTKEKVISPSKLQAKTMASNDGSDDDIKVLGRYRSYGRDTPESGELSDSPVRNDVRTVVVQHNHDERQRHRHEDKRESREAKSQDKLLDKFKYVQDISASIPEAERTVKVLPKPQDTVFDRLGTKRKRKSDDNKFDLRHKITGKKSPALTGYGIRDQFLISESSNDSSVMEVRGWSPPPASAGSESFAESFKWYDRKPLDMAPAPELRDERNRDRRSPVREMSAYFQDRARWDDQRLRDRTLTDGYSKEKDRIHKEWDRNLADRNRLWDEYWQRESRQRQEFYDGRSRDGYQRDISPRYSKEPHTFDRPPFWQHNQRNMSPERSRRSLSKDRSSRSYQRHSFSDSRSWRDSPRDRPSQRHVSHDGSSTGSFHRDRSSLDRPSRPSSRSSQRSDSRDRPSSRQSSRSSRRSRSRDRASVRSESTTSSISLDSAPKRPLSRNSSISSPVELSNTTPGQSGNQQKDSHFGSLDERLEKEHGITPAKKRKFSTDATDSVSDTTSVASEKVDGSAVYRNLCTQLGTLKQSVTKAARSFRDLNRHELKSRVERYQERYKKLQDMAIQAMESHYELDRVPSELDRDIQQRLLEMITDIECQREGLDKYKTSSDGKGADSSSSSSKTSKNRSDRSRSDGLDKNSSSRTSSDLANQVYDRRQNKKYSTYSPVRSSSGKINSVQLQSKM